MVMCKFPVCLPVSDRLQRQRRPWQRGVVTLEEVGTWHERALTADNGSGTDVQGWEVSNDLRLVGVTIASETCKSFLCEKNRQNYLGID